MAGNQPISSLLLAELYQSGQREFFARILAHRDSFKPILGLIEKWKKDSRPWANQLKLEFAHDAALWPSHRVVFKRLFKQAIADANHELLGAFMVRLDRSIRRTRVRKYRYRTAGTTITEVLQQRPGRMHSIFSGPTTHYLRRRAWRYFRSLGYADSQAYVTGIAGALIRYTDDDVRVGENLLDNWGLMHACFGKSPVLEFNAQHTNLRPTHRLAQLDATPMFERHWAQPASASTLLSILLDAGCRTIRVWTIALLKRHHAAALASVEPDMLLRLIDHIDPDVAAFAAELLHNASTVAALPTATWLKFLQTRNASALAAVCEAFRKHVNFGRVTLAQAVDIAISVATPVATLGLEILQQRSIRAPADREQIARLAWAQCAAVGRNMSQFAMANLNIAGIYSVEQIIGFFDNRLATVRAGAFVALHDPSPAAMDPAFWSRLLESPHDDIRIELVKRLSARQKLPGASSDALAFLWRGVLLNIHRGGRAKLSALRQISDHLVADPKSAGLLLPVVSVAIRSVRAPEARHGLAAIVAAVDRNPALADEAARHLPELQFDPAGAPR